VEEENIANAILKVWKLENQFHVFGIIRALLPE
jgi:hypothetical protein